MMERWTDFILYKQQIEILQNSQKEIFDLICPNISEWYAMLIHMKIKFVLYSFMEIKFVLYSFTPVSTYTFKPPQHDDGKKIKR